MKNKTRIQEIAHRWLEAQMELEGLGVRITDWRHDKNQKVMELEIEELKVESPRKEWLAIPW
ncbi:MAG: hypothetical protein GY847_23790 [Proteobacteria bacterium]|nr:hypothetical protein [Pseudomonadota bacterium]